MTVCSPRERMANCDGIPARSQPIIFSMKSTVFFRSVNAPNEKRIKSGLANNSASASTSSSRKERRTSRSVCNCMVGTRRCGVRTAQRAVHTLTVSAVMARSDIRAWCELRFIIRRWQRTTRNTRDQRNRRIHQVSPPRGKQQLIALHVICTSERPKLFLAKGRSAQR